MTRRDLHSALKTEVIGRKEDGNFILVLVRLQHGKDDITYSLHVDPRSFTTAGLQTTDLLAYLGFHRSACSFVPHGGCYVREADGDVDLNALAEAFGRCYGALQGVERHLNPCGIFLDQPEGWGYFSGKPSGGREHRFERPSGDGHTAPKSERMKGSEDEVFRYVFTWLEGGRDKGWTTHYRPQHPPLSREIQAALDFLGGFNQFKECPEFDFEPCYWRFMPYEQRGDSLFDSNADFAHRSFDAHAEHFSPGIEQLLAAHAEMQPYGMNILHLPEVVEHEPEPIAEVGAPAVKRRKTAEPSPYRYDVALSFAGPERPLAENLANIVRDAGFTVFYDSFYREQLWGKDLVAFFDKVYRKESRYCVIFVSREYAERMWTNHERRSAQARALEERGKEYILPIQVDDAELEGMPPTMGRLELSRYSIEEIGEILLNKLRGSGSSNSARAPESGTEVTATRLAQGAHADVRCRNCGTYVGLLIGSNACPTCGAPI